MRRVIESFIKNEEISNLAIGSKWLTTVEEGIVLNVEFVEKNDDRFHFRSVEEDYPREFYFNSIELKQSIWKMGLGARY